MSSLFGRWAARLDAQEIRGAGARSSESVLAPKCSASVPVSRDPGGPMKTPSRRNAKRVIAGRHPSLPGLVNFGSAEMEGSGTILNISASGAAIDDATLTLPVGAKVELFFLQPETGRKLRAVAEVVRESETGFAVRFLRLERELEKLVLRAAKDGERKNS